jgi:hypothetical protein
MALMSRTKVFRCGAAFCFSALTLGVAAPSRADPFRFPWDPPPRQPERVVTTPQAGSVLARQGARMVGTPHARGRETVEPIATTEKARRRPVEKRRDLYDDLALPERPLPAPHHSLEGLDDLPELTPVEPTMASVKPGELVPVATPPQSSTTDPAPADAALSPIKPLPGAPKIEPLPQ